MAGDILPDSEAIKAIPELSKIFKSKVEEINAMDIDEFKKENVIRMLYSLRHLMGLDRRERLIQQKKIPKGSGSGGGAVGSSRRDKKDL